MLGYVGTSLPVAIGGRGIAAACVPAAGESSGSRGPGPWTTAPAARRGGCGSAARSEGPAVRLLGASLQWQGKGLAGVRGSRAWLGAALAACCWAVSAPAATIRVPQDVATLEAALLVATAGDTILFAPGEHPLSTSVVIDIPLTLASEFVLSADPADVHRTTLIGPAGETAITFDVGADGSRMVGLGLTGAHKGLVVNCAMDIEHNRFFALTNDALNYEGVAGLCARNVVENNGDDGIDMDEANAVVIEGNVIRNNADDGIEMRLHPYTGAVVTTRVRDNEIYGNGEDGIQLIDYDGASSREIWIHHNLIRDNAMVGVGSMGGGVTIEDFAGSAMVERVYVFNNTILNNDHGLTGGRNMIALNNVVAGHSVGIKAVGGGSVVAHTLLFDNAVDTEACVLGDGLLIADPLLDDAFAPTVSSPCVDAGVARFTWQEELVLSLSEERYSGVAPDLGAREAGTTIVGPGVNTPPVIHLSGPLFVVAPEQSLSIEPTVTDDGLPSGSLSYQWSGEGPTAPEFSDATRPETAVSLAREGQYQLTLVVSDGELASVGNLGVFYVSDHEPQNSTTLAGESGWIEAEDYLALIGPAVTRADETASAGRAVAAGQADSHHAGATFHELVFTEEDQSYYVWVRLKSPEGDVELAVALAESEELRLAVPATEDFVWLRSDGSFSLHAGRYLLRIEAPTEGVVWDALFVTADPHAVPEVGTVVPGAAGGGAGGEAGGFGDGGARGGAAGGVAGGSARGGSSAGSAAREAAHEASRDGCGCRTTGGGSGGLGTWAWLLLGLAGARRAGGRGRPSGAEPSAAAARRRPRLARV